MKRIRVMIQLRDHSLFMRWGVGGGGGLGKKEGWDDYKTNQLRGGLFSLVQHSDENDYLVR